LEHAINIEEVKGKTPMHRELLSGSSKMVNSIDVYSDRLMDMNEQVRKMIMEVEERNSTLSFRQDLEAEGADGMLKQMSNIICDSDALNELSSGSVTTSNSARNTDTARFEPQLQVLNESDNTSSPRKSGGGFAPVRNENEDDSTRKEEKSCLVSFEVCHRHSGRCGIDWFKLHYRKYRRGSSSSWVCFFLKSESNQCRTATNPS
jgi:hypothetical protein